MKSAILCLATLLLAQTLPAFASEGSGFTENQFHAADGMKTCIDFTKTLANEGLCRHLLSDPAVTISCNQTTRSARHERLCLLGQVAPAAAADCQENSFTRSEQVQCLKQASN